MTSPNDLAAEVAELRRSLAELLRKADEIVLRLDALARSVRDEEPSRAESDSVAAQ
jgi:hypothetical protein